MVFNVDRNSALKLVQDSSFMASGYSADCKYNYNNTINKFTLKEIKISFCSPVID